VKAITLNKPPEFVFHKIVRNPLLNFIPAIKANKTHGNFTSFAVNTHHGLVRSSNEDRVSIVVNIYKPKNKKYEKPWPQCSYFALYDGHSGTACADFLKSQLHHIIIK
jgi:protein phosphatase 2C family protein 2/3